MIKLPEALVARLRKQLGPAGYEAYAACLREEPRAGLRFNMGKGSDAELRKLLPFELKPVPWAPSGYEYPRDARPAKSPYYYAGLYYLQEPSAMVPAAALGVAPGDRALDLCAAPGGKATQLADALGGTGVLVANDSNAKRVKSLIWNLEHWGATRYVALNETPRELASSFSGYFDKVLVDAPCSGEGMFRRDPGASRSWRVYSGDQCRRAQDEILDHAVKMLAPGGRLMYSTCTFNPQENEDAVAALLQRHRELGMEPLPMYEGWQSGVALAECRLLWPHLTRGEGQFMALISKPGPDGKRVTERGKKSAETRSFADTHEPTPESEPNRARSAEPNPESGSERAKANETIHAQTSASAHSQAAQPTPAIASARSRVAEPTPANAYTPANASTRSRSAESTQTDSRRAPPAALERFMEDNLNYPIDGPFAVYQGHVYQIAYNLPDLAGLKVSRHGWYLGKITNERFTPSQPMAIGLKTGQFKKCLDLDPNGSDVQRYIRSETLMTQGERGLTLVTLAGFPLGFGKQEDGFFKNMYSSGWRLT